MAVPLNTSFAWFVDRYALFTLTGAVVAFQVADWVSDRYLRGFESSVATLNSSINRTAERIDALDAAMRRSIDQLQRSQVAFQQQTDASVGAIARAIRDASGGRRGRITVRIQVDE